MSGPKLSAADLARIQQERLERERQEALRRLTEARNAYENTCSLIHQVIRNNRELLNSLDAVYRGTISSEMERIFLRFDMKTINSGDPKDYLQQKESLERILKESTPKMNELLKDARRKQQIDSEVSQINNQVQSFSDSLSQKGNEVESILLRFDSNYSETEMNRFLQEALDHFESRILSNAAPEMNPFDKKAVALINGIMNNRSLNPAEISNTMQKLFNDEAEMIRVSGLWKEKYKEYQALAGILSFQPVEISKFTSLDELEKTVNDLREEYRKKDEMDFIADTINEVMADMGYSIVSSTVLQKQDLSETEYSLYRDGDNNESGVAVYTDQSGGVLMRMTVLGDSEEISDSDRDFSYQCQIDFCSKHDDLVEELKKRGVILKQKSYKSPNKDHTFKVNATTSGEGSVSSGSNGTNETAKKVRKINRRARRRGSNNKMRSV